MTNRYKVLWLLLAVITPAVFAASPVISANKVHYHWAPTAFHAEPCTRADCDEATIWRPTGKANPQKIGGGTDGEWVAMPAPTTEPNRMCSANPYDDVNVKVYMIGGDPAGYYGVANCQRFDPLTNTWTDLASMPGARTWLDGEGSYCRHLGKIYIAGGYTGSANNNMWEYDIATNTWTSRASMPTATLAYMSGIWNDSLIYIMGGAGPSLSGTNVVQIYNVNQNTWATGTQLPEAGDMGSGTIVGDTIYITNAYNRQSGVLWANARKGAINPSNPTQITWSNWTDVPTLGFNGGTTRVGGWVYRLGGFTSLTGSAHKRGWRYNIATGAYETLPWLPSPPTTGVARCNFLSRCEATNELFKIAGDDEGNWSTPNNTYYRNQFTPPHDVGVSEILEPASPKIQVGVPILPKVKVKNYGLNPEYDIAVSFRVDSAGTIIYEDAALIDTLAVGEEVEVEFAVEWTPNCAMWHGYTVYGFTVLDGDPIPGNDTCMMYTIRTTDTIYSYRSSSTPSIDGYIAPGEWDDGYFVSFPNVYGWEGTPYPWNAARAWFKHDGSYLYAAYALPLALTRDIGDQIGFYLDENGDGQWASDNSEGNYWYWVNGSGADEVIYRPITPGGPGTPGVAPGAQSVTGVFNGFLVFETRTPFGVLPYQLNLNPSADTSKMWMFGLDNGRFFGWWPVDMPSDSWLLPYWYGTFVLLTQQTGDVGVKSIDAPRSARPGDVVTPKATWKNYGSTAMNFTAYYLIDDPSGTRVYSESQSASLAGGAEIQLTFPNLTVNTEGDWAVKCSTVAGGDVNPANDIKTGSFRVSTAPPWPYGWVEVKSIPGEVKDGAWLAYNEENGLIYAARGNKSGDFYSYDPNADTAGAWTTLAPIPAAEGKLPRKGAAGCYGGGYVYATTGNNTFAFQRYSIEGGNWEPLQPVPAGASGKALKGGTDMVYVVEEGVGYVYLLKGYKQDFFRYNTVSGAWESLPAAPAGAKPKWDKGSWLVYDGENTLYAHKAKYSEMWTFDLTTHQWGTASLPGIPTSSSKTGKNKKSKDGSDGAYVQGFIYALKGGNTCEWWRYSVAGGSWIELDPMPEIGSTGKKKRVKAGGALTNYGTGFAFFALKGGKTREFWRYVDSTPVFASRPERSGVMAEKVNAVRFGFSVAPNPVVRGYGVLNYSVPQAGEVRLVVFDVTGRAVKELGFVASGTGTRNLDLRDLAAGVYLVKFTSGDNTASQKLIVR